MPWSGDRLSPAKVERASYVDYEGTPHSAPTVLGIMVEAEIEQWIVEEVFDDCAHRRRAPAHCASQPVLVHEVVARAAAEDRRVVSWTTHDAREMAVVLDEVEPLETVYRNAIKTARSWRYRHGPPLEDSHTLSWYMGLLS